MSKLTMFGYNSKKSNQRPLLYSSITRESVCVCVYAYVDEGFSVREDE